MFYGDSQINVEDGRIEPTRFGIRGIGPHVHITYRGLGVGDTKYEERIDLAKRIAALLNGESQDREGLCRLSEERGSFTGIPFSATGPCVDIDPPNCNWREDQSTEAKNARARLMDAIFGISRTNERTPNA